MESDLTHNPPQVTEVQPITKQSNFLVTLLSILLLIAVFIAGFFAYQTQNLVKELTKLQVTPTPIASSQPQILNISPLLIKNNNSLTVPKFTQIGWNKSLSQYFSINYPNNWTCSSTVSNISCSANKTALIDGKDWDISIDKVDGTFIDNANKISISVANDLDKVAEYKPEYKDVNLPDNLKGILIGNSHLVFETSGYVFSIYFSDIDNQDQIKILSSFGIINSDQTACTMEAKVCPDGTAVGRSGPKCEFAPCPTTSPQL